MHCSLRHPPEGIPLLHVLLWPWIYAQLVALRLWVRRHYGPGVPYRFQVSAYGRVRLVSMPGDLTWSHAANAPLLEPRFSFTTGIPRPALTLACLSEGTPRAPAPLLRTGTLHALRALLQPLQPDTS